MVSRDPYPDRVSQCKTPQKDQDRLSSESRLGFILGPIFRPLLDSETRTGSQGYVLSGIMVYQIFFSLATWGCPGIFDHRFRFLECLSCILALHSRAVVPSSVFAGHSRDRVLGLYRLIYLK